MANGLIDTADAWAAVIDPGEMLCFSGAHLHASIPNTTDVARFNIETRTVCIDDLAAERGAPDLDHTAPAAPWNISPAWWTGRPWMKPWPAINRAKVRSFSRGFRLLLAWFW